MTFHFQHMMDDQKAGPVATPIQLICTTLSGNGACLYTLHWHCIWSTLAHVFVNDC